MKEWVKLYTEINRDSAVGCLTWEQRGIWSALLALAGELDHRDDEGEETGALEPLRKVAWHIRCDVQTLSKCVEELTSQGMIDERDGILYVTNYTKRQSRPPSSSRESVYERVKQHRQRKKSDCNEGVTTLHRECNEGVTTLEKNREDKKRIDKNRSEENDATIAPLETLESSPTLAPIAPSPAVQIDKSKSKARKGTADERTNHPAIRAFHSATGRRPHKDTFDLIIQTLGDVPEIERLKNCYVRWRANGWRADNLAWLTEWYTGGIPEKSSNNQRNGGKPSAVNRQYPGPPRHVDPAKYYGPEYAKLGREPPG